MRLELRDIEYFAVVAEHLHVGRAAEALGLSQPALSRSLRRLEASVQSRVVRRTPKGVELTTVGTALLSRIRRLRLAMEDVIHEAVDLSHGTAGYLRIGVGPSFDDLPAAYNLLLKEAPRLALKIVMSDNDSMAAAIRDGHLDLFVNYIPALPPGDFAQEHLYDDVTVVCAPAQHPLAKLKRVSMDDIARERWILAPPHIPHVQWLLRTLHENGRPLPQTVVEVHSMRLRLQTLATSNLLGFMSRRILQQAAGRMRLKELPLKELQLRRPVGVVYRKDGYLPPSARQFIDLLKGVTKTIATG
jgi:DNA-binding transcriptional LysR family regulator